jgi:DNA-binding HxlR family transcriptional regulator
MIEHTTHQPKATRCPAGIFSVGGRLKLQIAYHLLSGTKRFGELQRLVPETSRQMLTLHLRELEHMGLLHRQVYTQMPPKVEYSLTELGWESEPMLRQFNAWGEQMGFAF